MQLEIVPFPAGNWGGVPVLRCEIGPEDPLTAVEVISIRGHVRPGVQMLWFHTARWGERDLDRFLLDVAQDEQLREFPITAIRPLGAKMWSALGDMQLVIDISDVFSMHEMNTETIQQSAAMATAVPRMKELIWREPPIGNVTPAALEAIHDQLTPDDQAWLYFENDGFAARGFRACVRAHAQWAMGRKLGDAWPATM